MAALQHACEGWRARVPAGRLALNLLAGLVILVVAAVAPRWARAADAGIVGSEMQGYGRLVLQFDKPTAVKARVSGGVLVVGFTEPAGIDPEKIATQMPNYVSVGRRDPDGRGIRFGLVRAVRADVKEAGEKVYIDLLPANWVGLPPALPAEVVQDLARRARVAEEIVRRVEKESDKRIERAITLDIARAPLFTRAIFDPHGTVPIVYSAEGGKIALGFEGRFTIDEGEVTAKLAGMVSDLSITRNDTGVLISFRPVPALSARGFREDDTFAIDFSRADPGAAKPEASTADTKPGSKAAAEPTRPRAEAARPEAAASSEPRVASTGAPPRGPDKPADAGGENGSPEPAIAEAAEVKPGRLAIPARALARIAAREGGFDLALGAALDTPIAVVRRGPEILILVDTPEALSIDAAPGGAGTIPPFRIENAAGSQVIRVNAGTGGLLSVLREPQGLAVAVGSDVLARTEAIGLSRGFDKAGNSSLTAAMPGAAPVRWMNDPLGEGKLALVPMRGSPRAVVRAQRFMEIQVPQTAMGLAVITIADDVTVRAEKDLVTIGREDGLAISAGPTAKAVADIDASERLIDVEAWRQARLGDGAARERDLLFHAAEAPRRDRSAARLKLAQHYLATLRAPEAHGVLETLVKDDAEFGGGKKVQILRVVTALLQNKAVEARQLLDQPVLALEPEAMLWRAAVDKRLGKGAPALVNFRKGQAYLDTYPEALQSLLRPEAIEAAIEAGDATFAGAQMREYDKLEGDFRSTERQQLYTARIAEAEGRVADALGAYERAARTKARDIEAEARLRRALLLLREKRDDQAAAKAEVETVAVIWRGGDIEMMALAPLGRMYAQDGRWRDAFQTARRATAIRPDDPQSRALEDDMANAFEALFLDNAEGKLSKVEALGLYYEFRTLIPIGRRGDEIARRLAERLYDLDLVDQATEILNHQIEHRLEGVARSAVAARLAVMHLANRQSAKALDVLRVSRLSTMPSDLRRARSLLEARALSEVGRADIALEVVAAENGVEVDRLRADILWRAKRWRDAGEAYERVLGERWRGGEPALTPAERNDALRAGVAFVLADERLALDRLRAKFLARMAESEDGEAFKLVTTESVSRPQAFREVARAVVSADTMAGFMEAYRQRYPETGGKPRVEAPVAQALNRG